MALERRAEAAAAAAAADGAAAVDPAMDAVLRAEASAVDAMRGMLRAPLDNAGVAADDAEGRITRAVGAGGRAASSQPPRGAIGELLLGAVGDGDDGGTVYDALEPKLAAIRASVHGRAAAAGGCDDHKPERDE